MLELICHHSYTWNGLPADQSAYRNHGTGIDIAGAADGVTAGSGVALFPQSSSRIEIALNDDTRQAWQPITAVKVEVLARMDPMARREFVFVDADRSFRFGVIEGATAAQFTNASGQNNFIRSDENYTLNGAYRPVPTNKWVTLGFQHDGYARMNLLFNGEIIAQADVDGSIPSVQNLGVRIGNALGGVNRQFPGELDEIKIWRVDPRSIKREFLGRPITREAAECWEKAFRQIVSWAKENPEPFKALSDGLRSLNYEWLRVIHFLPPGERAKLHANTAAFSSLWFSGRLTGQAMQDVLCEWVILMRNVGLEPARPIPPSIVSTGEQLAEKVRLSDVQDCDPELAKFLDLLRWAVENCGINGEVRS